MAVDLGCAECLKLWEIHGAAAAELRDAEDAAVRGTIERRMRLAAQAIAEHEQQAHPTAIRT